MVILVMHIFLVIDPLENLVVLDLFDSEINEMHQMLSKAWMDMKWMAVNYVLTMLDMNARKPDHARDVRGQDLETVVDLDHVTEEGLDPDPADDHDDQEVVLEDEVEIEEVVPSQMIDLDHVTVNQNPVPLNVIEVGHVDVIAVDHVTNPVQDLAHDKIN